MGQIIRSPMLCLSVCLSVYVSVCPLSHGHSFVLCNGIKMVIQEFYRSARGHDLITRMPLCPLTWLDKVPRCLLAPLHFRRLLSLDAKWCFFIRTHTGNVFLSIQQRLSLHQQGLAFPRTPYQSAPGWGHQSVAAISVWHETSRDLDRNLCQIFATRLS